MKISSQKAGDILFTKDNILILTHKSPDGDTLGSGFALMRVLKKLGKKCAVICSDKIEDKFLYLSEGLINDEFVPDYIVAVDVADEKLLGDFVAEKYAGKIDLCIDHHASNTMYAKDVCLHPEDAATAQSIYRIMRRMNVEPDKHIADCIYTGISTDTGCFRYSNAVASTHIIAAAMIDAGADSGRINTAMFETKSLGYFRLLTMALDGLSVHYNNLCSFITVTQDMFEKTGTSESDCDAISAIARQIEGVKIGITMREKKDGSYKFSVRTHEPVDAAVICKNLGGGGHARAAGCEAVGKNREQSKNEMLDIVEKELKRLKMI